MRQIFFAYCNQLKDCEEVLRVVDDYFTGSGWNLVIPENALNVKMNHPLKVSFSIVDKSDLLLIDLTSKRKEMVMIHEHAVNKGMEIMYIGRKNEKVLEDLKQHEKSVFWYDSPAEILPWLEESVVAR